MEHSSEALIPVITADDMPRALFAALQGMDREATTVKNEWPTGLRWYSEHERIQYPERRRKKSDDERSWCRRLYEIFSSRDGVRSVTIDQKYQPDRQLTCDLVFQLNNSESIWVEVKGAWTYTWDYPILARNGSYKKHLLTDANASVLADFAKLRANCSSSATYAGVLLVGFDSEQETSYSISDQDIALVRTHAGVDADKWPENYDSWDDVYQNDFSERKSEAFKVRVWYWQHRLQHD